MMFMDVIVTSSETIENVAFGGFAIGLIFGLCFSYIMFILWRNAMARNFKLFLFEQKNKDRETFEQDFDKLLTLLERLARKTNTQLFKTLFNWLNDVKTLIKRKNT